MESYKIRKGDLMIIEKNKNRVKFIFLIIIIIIITFLFRLAHLQIVDGEKYSEIAENKMLRHIISPAERGKIFTNDGHTLATNRIGDRKSVV